MASNFMISFIFTIISRLSGFFKALLTTRYLGTGPMGDLSSTVLKFPNIIRNITVDGAFHYSIVPELLKIQSENEFRDICSKICSFFFTISLILSIILIFFMDKIINFIIPMNSLLLKTFSMLDIILMFRIIVPSIMVIIFASIFTSILNSRDDFKFSAIAPMIGNILFIITIIIIPYIYSSNWLGYGPTIVSISHILNLFIQCIWLLIGFKKNNIIIYPTLKMNLGLQLYKNILKGFFSQLLLQLYNLILGGFIAFRLKIPGAIASLDISDKIISATCSALGTISLVSMGNLSKQYNNNKSLGQKAAKNIIINFLPILFVIISYIYFFHNIIISFIFYGKNINIPLINNILKISIFIIPTTILNKIFNSIMLVNGEINIVFFSSFFGAITGACLELLLYKTIDYRAIIFGMFGTSIIKFLILLYFLLKKQYLIFSVKDLVSWNSPFIILILTFILNYIGLYLLNFNIFFGIIINLFFVFLKLFILKANLNMLFIQK